MSANMQMQKTGLIRTHYPHTITATTTTYTCVQFGLQIYVRTYVRDMYVLPATKHSARLYVHAMAEEGSELF